MNWGGIIMGPQRSTLDDIETRTGTRLVLRGKDAPPESGLVRGGAVCVVRCMRMRVFASVSVLWWWWRRLGGSTQHPMLW